jgi:hypothetical protein
LCLLHAVQSVIAEQATQPFPAEFTTLPEVQPVHVVASLQVAQFAMAAPQVTQTLFRTCLLFVQAVHVVASLQAVQSVNPAATQVIQAPFLRTLLFPQAVQTL